MVIIRRVRVSFECLLHKATRKRGRGHEKVHCTGKSSSPSTSWTSSTSSASSTSSTSSTANTWSREKINPLMVIYVKIYICRWCKVLFYWCCWNHRRPGPDVEHKENVKKSHSASPRDWSKTSWEGLRPRHLRRGWFSFQFIFCSYFQIIYNPAISVKVFFFIFSIKALTHLSCIHNQYAYYRNESIIHDP